ncbi:MAG: proton-conducting transporter membrane subunit [Elusimicrobiota bacterium]
MENSILLLPILIPLVVAGMVLVFLNDKFKLLNVIMFLTAIAANTAVAVLLFSAEMDYTLPWAGFGMDFALKVFKFNSFILLAITFFAVAVGLYSISFMWKKTGISQYLMYFLVTLGFVNGAVLADNLILLLFFWEGLLLPLFGFIVVGNKAAFKTAIKAFIIVGISDLCMMVGIGMTGFLADTLTLSEIHLPLSTMGSIAFVLLIIGATAKAGSMPFHSWIPDAAVDAPLPFMALLPASMEKLLGIYFLARIALDLYQLTPDSWLSTLLMILGGVTILLAVMMALVQKDYKKLLSYHAISQVGYMVLGIGTCVPAGIIGGVFHMLNHAMYKCALFFTAGAVEKQAGTTDLQKLGGLLRSMPITFGVFVIAAASISGVPPFNGFFSKELVYDGTFIRGQSNPVFFVFYAMALLGSFFTAASFLKLGHAVYIDSARVERKDIKDPDWWMLTPMVAIACICILFGVYNELPIKNFIEPVLMNVSGGGAGASAEVTEDTVHHGFSGWPSNWFLVLMTGIVIFGAIINHVFGVKKGGGSGLNAAEHIHYAPGLVQAYNAAEKRLFDPYDIGLSLTNVFARILYWFDRFIDWIYDKLAGEIADAVSLRLRLAHNGDYSLYIIWAIVGTVIVVLMIM